MENGETENEAVEIPGSVTCPTCNQVRYTKEPCVYCYGSLNPGKQTCSTCYSYRNRMCHRLEAEVAGWWNGCTLHCPKVLVTGE